MRSGLRRQRLLPGQVFTELSGLDDLPLARASVRQEFLRRGRRWRDQLQEETERLRDSFQQAGDRFEERLEGWLEEEPAWDVEQRPDPIDQRVPGEAWDDWSDEPPEANPSSTRRTRQQREDQDPWL